MFRVSLERFRREASLAASIDHPNVVKIFQVGSDGDRHFMALEFLPENLARVIQSGGQMRIDRAADFATQIAEGLAAAHVLGIVHRDVKPQNILIGPDGVLKVTDFGIARAEELSTMTATGAVMGTPHYMSPEQARGERAEIRSDVYSLGCVLYQMLAGELPFKGDTPLAVIRQQIEEQPRPLREVRRDVPRELASVVERAMRKDPRRRYESASDMGSALRAAVPGIAPPKPAAAPAPPVPSRQPEATEPPAPTPVAMAKEQDSPPERRRSWLRSIPRVAAGVVLLPFGLLFLGAGWARVSERDFVAAVLFLAGGVATVFAAVLLLRRSNIRVGWLGRYRLAAVVAGTGFALVVAVGGLAEDGQAEPGLPPAAPESSPLAMLVPTASPSPVPATLTPTTTVAHTATVVPPTTRAALVARMDTAAQTRAPATIDDAAIQLAVREAVQRAMQAVQVAATPVRVARMAKPLFRHLHLYRYQLQRLTA